ncbi:perlucin-like protein, partial [Contarinia nasturtii]|uniref:perlucin-like protein n=1 Tax=Contarinia nasturtii TaxID=265458 RepID=UPI0012D4487B
CDSFAFYNFVIISLPPSYFSQGKLSILGHPGQSNNPDRPDNSDYSESSRKRSKKYYLEPFVKTNWYKANAYCRSRGMDLVSIKSHEENLDVLTFIRDAGFVDESFWTAGTILGDTRYYWINDDVRFRYTDWSNGQPDNYQNQEQCMQLRSEYNFRWNDESCNTNCNIICESPLYGTHSTRLLEFDIHIKNITN